MNSKRRSLSNQNVPQAQMTDLMGDDSVGRIRRWSEWAELAARNGVLGVGMCGFFAVIEVGG